MKNIQLKLSLIILAFCGCFASTFANGFIKNYSSCSYQYRVYDVCGNVAASGIIGPLSVVAISVTNPIAVGAREVGSTSTGAIAANSTSCAPPVDVTTGPNCGTVKVENMSFISPYHWGIDP